MPTGSRRSLSHAASIPLVKAWQDNKPAPMGLCNVASMDSKFWEMTGGKCLGEVTYNFIARAPLTDRTVPMWDKYVEGVRHQPRLYTTGFTYDAVYMLAEVIKQKKSLKSDDIIDGLENISYKGVLHPETGFDKETHDLLEGRYVMPMVQWQEGGKAGHHMARRLQDRRLRETGMVDEISLLKKRVGGREGPKRRLLPPKSRNRNGRVHVSVRAVIAPDFTVGRNDVFS